MPAGRRSAARAYGYEDHVNADAKHKLIRRYAVSDAAVHDSQELDRLLNKGNTSDDVFADSAYRSAQTKAKLKARGFRSRIHVRASRGHPLSQAEEDANQKKSRVRARIEHVFGAQQTTPGGRLVPTIGIVKRESGDRIPEPRLQHPSPRHSPTHGRRMSAASASTVPEWPAALRAAASASNQL